MPPDREGGRLMKTTVVKTLLMLLVGAASALLFASESRGEERVVRVKYVSADHIYVDGGTSQGIAVGDTLTVTRDSRQFARLLVVFVAEQSASCEIVASEGAIQPGDVVTLPPKAEEVAPVEETADTLPAETGHEVGSVETDYGIPRPAPRIDGSIAVQFYHFNDRNPADLDFTQPTLRLNFRATNLWNEKLSMRVVSRTRYNRRTRSYSDDVSRDKWRNNIYQMALFYADDSASLSLQLGRIVLNKVSGVGYIDGLSAQVRPSKSFAIGGFAGYEPGWQYADFQSNLHKYGLYLSYEYGEFRSFRVQSTAAAAAEYHSSTVSRQFVYLQTTMSNGARWQLYQNSTVEINSDWRKEKTGKSVNLSRIYLSARYRFSHRVAVAATYDSFENYWTWESRTLADSLFDDNLRQGLRGHLYLTLPNSVMLSGSIGYRKRDGDPESSKSYSAALSKSNVTSLRLYGSLSIVGFKSYYSDGYNFLTRWSKYVSGGHRIGVEYGRYSYTYSAGDGRHTSNSYGVNGYFRIPRNLYLRTDFQYSTGDDIDGERILMELGYRF